MFELLFKYPLGDYQAGHIELSWPWLLFWAIAAAGTLFAAWRYLARPAGGRRSGWNVVLALLRAGALASLVFALAQPVLVTPAATGHRGAVAVLVDDSRSMRLRDQDGASRAEWIVEQLDVSRPGLGQALSRRFDVRVLALSGGGRPLERQQGAGEEAAPVLRFDAAVTDIAAGLAGVQGATGSGKLAGVVLLSDGAHNAAGDPSASTSGGWGAIDRALLALRAAGTPVLAVGLGRPRAPDDVELALAPVPSRVRLGNSLRVGARVSAQGRAGEPATLTLTDDGRIVERREIDLPADGEGVLIELDTKLADPGARRLRVAVVAANDEAVTANNARETLVDVIPAPASILYVEGEPRFELKFLRRAVEDDEQLRLVSLLRMAANRLYRLGVTGPEELEDGFPASREELFRYRALVVGSVDAGFFSERQRALIESFVEVRGGGLLMLGGRLSFAEGGYAGTPLAALSPVALSAEGTGPVLRTVQAAVANTGASHPLGRLLAQPGSPERRLSALADLPPLSSVNRWGPLKPGASVLLEDVQTGAPLFVWQRYGRGLSAALAVRDVWRWQMHPDVAVEDQTHEQFWRQVLRWLSDAAPGRLQISSQARAAPGESVSVRIEARDGGFEPAPADAVSARVVSPDGAEADLELTIAPDGEAYVASFAPGAEGVYEVRASITSAPGAPAGHEAGMPVESRALLGVSVDAHEPFAAGLDEGLLARVADGTGGALYAPSEIAALVSNLESRTPSDTAIERRPLWDLPVLALALLALLSLEWPLRRWRGLR